MFLPLKLRIIVLLSPKSEALAATCLCNVEIQPDADGKGQLWFWPTYLQQREGKKMDLQIGRQVAGSVFHWRYWSTYFMGC